MTSTALQSSFGVGVPIQANGSATASSCDAEIPPPGVSANSLCSSLAPYRRKLLEALSLGDAQVLI